MSRPEYPCPTCKTQPGVPLPTGVVDCERCYQSKRVLTSAVPAEQSPSWTETWRKAVTPYWDDEDTV